MQPESSEAIIKRICRALSRADGFALYFVLVNLPSARRAFARQVIEQLERPVIELDVPAQGFGDTTLDGWLLPQMEDAPAESAIFLHGLNHVMPTGQVAQRRFLQQLNWRRGVLASVGRPLVIWLPRYALDNMAEHAPDLYDWYSNVYEFASPAEEAEELRSSFLTEFGTAVHPANRQSNTEKEQWLHTLTVLLDEHPQRNAYRAKLLDDAAHLHRALGNMDDAFELDQQSLAIRQELGDRGIRRNNYFSNRGVGEQNIAQGEGVIGKQVNVMQEIYGDNNIVSGMSNVTVSKGIVTEQLATKYAEKLRESKQLIEVFLNTLVEHEESRDQWDSILRKLIAMHKELLTQLEAVQSEDPQVVRLKDEVRQAIEVGKYTDAEKLLNQAESRDIEALEQVEEVAQRVQRRISAAASNAENARLQRLQLRYAKAAVYWQKAANLLPEDRKKERSLYLHRAGFDLNRIGRYTEALPLYEQSLYILRDIGDRTGEGATLNNIGQIYRAQGDDTTALNYLEQSLRIRREIGNKAGESATLNNISQIYQARGDYASALKYLKQSLTISQEIGDRVGEASSSWNIGHAYRELDELCKAEPYMSQAVKIAEQINLPFLEKYRKVLAKLRVEMKGR
nr:tetratricopeptide repeat protein [Candidatus Electrothrix aestuarii]